jgi:hypothetical protein
MATTLDRVASGPRQTQTEWQIDPDHSEVGFSVKHLVISTVRGRFAGIRGTIVLKAANVTRQMASAWRSAPRRPSIAATLGSTGIKRSRPVASS